MAEVVSKAEEDTRPEVLDLLKNIKASLPKLEKELSDANGHWTFEDGIYRFYHQSFKVFFLQNCTEAIVKLLEELAPAPDPKRERPKFWYYREKTSQETPTALHPWFMKIVKEGTGKQFDLADNQKWLEVTRPILEAFFHAKFFLEMIVKYGKELGDVPPNMLPSGWASVLYLYDLR